MYTHSSDASLRAAYLENQSRFIHNAAREPHLAVTVAVYFPLHSIQSAQRRKFSWARTLGGALSCEIVSCTASRQNSTHHRKTIISMWRDTGLHPDGEFT